MSPSSSNKSAGEASPPGHLSLRHLAGSISARAKRLRNRQPSNPSRATPSSPALGVLQPAPASRAPSRAISPRRPNVSTTSVPVPSTTATAVSGRAKSRSPTRSNSPAAASSNKAKRMISKQELEKLTNALASYLNPQNPLKFSQSGIFEHSKTHVYEDRDVLQTVEMPTYQRNTNSHKLGNAYTLVYKGGYVYKRVAMTKVDKQLEAMSNPLKLMPHGSRLSFSSSGTCRVQLWLQLVDDNRCIVTPWQSLFALPYNEKAFARLTGARSIYAPVLVHNQLDKYAGRALLPFPGLMKASIVKEKPVQQRAGKKV